MTREKEVKGKRHFLYGLLLFGLTFMSLNAQTEEIENKSAPHNDTVRKPKRTIQDWKKEATISLGNPDSPIQVTYHMMINCDACNSFVNTRFEAIKQHYIDTGKVRWTFQFHPLGLVPMAFAVTLPYIPSDKKYAFFTATMKIIGSDTHVLLEWFNGLLEKQGQHLNLESGEVYKKENILPFILYQQETEGLISFPTVEINGKRYETGDVEPLIDEWVRKTF